MKKNLYYILLSLFLVTVLFPLKVNAAYIKDPENCDHSAVFIDSTYYYREKVLIKPTSTEWGAYQTVCQVCGTVVSESKLHPVDTYEVVMQDGTVKTLEGWFDHDYAHDVFDLTNTYRQENNLNTLSYNEVTQDDSDLRALEAAAYFSHTRPNGTRWNTVTDKWTYGGENLASGHPTPESVMTGWKNSPGHNHNLLYGKESGETPYQGLSVGVFRQMTYDQGYPREIIAWSQNFTFYRLDAETESGSQTTTPTTDGGTTDGGTTGGDGTYRNLEWEEVNGKSYWYENNVRQGTYSDDRCFSYDGTLRGREIYDPTSDGWYWLDVNADGAKAVGKEVFMPYIYQNQKDWDEDTINANAAASGANADGNLEHAELAEQVKKAIKDGTGKWVRYDHNGKMFKGWVLIDDSLASLYPDQVGNIYYYDRKTGLMAKGRTVIDGRTYYFDEITGVLK